MASNNSPKLPIFKNITNDTEQCQYGSFGIHVAKQQISPWKFLQLRKKSDHKPEVYSASKLKHVTQIDFF